MADMSATLRLDRLLERIFGRDVCEAHFGAVHTLSATEERALRDLIFAKLTAHSYEKVSREALKHDIMAFLKTTPALDEGFHSPEVLLRLMMQDAS